MVRRIFPPVALLFAATASASSLPAEEVFVSIQQVSGNRMAVVKDAAGGGGMRGGGQGGGQRGRRGGTGATQPIIVTVPGTAKITTAMRERRTFEFRVGAELAGGLRHRIFTEMAAPLSARIVTDGDRITEINVITDSSDINQSNTSGGGTVIAVKPKRPPTKRGS